MHAHCRKLEHCPLYTVQKYTHKDDRPVYGGAEWQIQALSADEAGCGEGAWGLTSKQMPRL